MRTNHEEIRGLMPLQKLTKWQIPVNQLPTFSTCSIDYF